MTLSEFRSSGRPVADLGEMLGDSAYGGMAGHSWASGRYWASYGWRDGSPAWITWIGSDCDAYRLLGDVEFVLWRLAETDRVAMSLGTLTMSEREAIRCQTTR